MAPRLIVMDESKQRRHRILSVGGVVMELDRLPEVEASWATAREAAGIHPGTPIKYSMNWPGGPDQRAQLIAAIGGLQLQAVISPTRRARPPDLVELDKCMTNLINLFPAAHGGIPPRRCGHSFIVHAGNRTGNELLRDNLDSWAHEVTPVPFDLGSPESEVPF